MATINHDSERWGWERAADGERSRLVRVGDLVAAFAKVEQRALPAAAGIVLDRLAGVALFELRKDDDATPVTAAFRFEKDGGCCWVEGADGFMGLPSQDPSEDLHGLSGAHEMLRLARHSAPDLAQGIAARLAVLQVDAAAAFPELDFGGQSSPCPSVAAVPALPLVLLERKPGDVWTVAQRVALLGYVDQRKKADPRLKSEALHEELGGAFSCSASNIKQQLAAARKGQGGDPMKKAA